MYTYVLILLYTLTSLHIHVLYILICIINPCVFYIHTYNILYTYTYYTHLYALYTYSNTCTLYTYAHYTCIQIISHVSRLHKQGIIHRDLKLSNILLNTENPLNPYLIINDFSSAINKECISLGLYGIEGPTQAELTLDYAPPEVRLSGDNDSAYSYNSTYSNSTSYSYNSSYNNFNGTYSYNNTSNSYTSNIYTESSDIWSIGVIILEILLGTVKVFEADMLDQRTKSLIMHKLRKFRNNVDYEKMLEEELYKAALSEFCIIPMSMSQSATANTATASTSTNAAATSASSTAVATAMTSNDDVCGICRADDASGTGEVCTEKGNDCVDCITTASGEGSKTAAVYDDEDKEALVSSDMVTIDTSTQKQLPSSSLPDTSVDTPRRSQHHHHSSHAHSTSHTCTLDTLELAILKRDPMGLGFPDPLGLDLLQRLLRYEPSERIPLSEALDHTYFTGNILPVLN